MNNPADYRSLVNVVFALLLHAAAVLVPVPWAFYPAWLLLASAMSFIACVINHNHIHTPVFSSEKLNHAFGILLTLAKGHTSATVLVPHNLNHHVHSGTPSDWIRVELAGQSQRPGRLLRYIWNASLSMRSERRSPLAPAPPRGFVARLRTERTALVVFSATLFAIHPLRFLAWVLVPWELAMAALVGINLLQHDGCAPFSRFDHSRNFVSPIGNWFLFNNGYHTIHHFRPRLHWSELPRAHARAIAPFIDPTLDEPSILRFLLSHYVLERPLPSHEGEETA